MKLLIMLTALTFIILMTIVLTYFITGRNRSSDEDVTMERSVSSAFTQHIDSLHGQVYIQVATILSSESFTFTSRSSIFWDAIQLPEVRILCTVPMTFVYYVDLDSKQWKIEEHDNDSITVTAPTIMWNAPSFDIQQFSCDITKKSVFRSEALAQKTFEKEMHLLADNRAESKVCYVRDTARRSIMKFFREWELKTYNATYVEDVYFKDENLE